MSAVSSKNQNISFRELEFAVFCIENIALKLHIDGERVFRALTEDSDILYDYIIPCYDALHTQGKEYILEDILTFAKEKGVCI